MHRLLEASGLVSCQTDSCKRILCQECGLVQSAVFVRGFLVFQAAVTPVLLAGHVLFQLRRSFFGLLQLLIQSLLNVIHGSRVSQPESSSSSGSVTRVCSYSQLPAVLEGLSRNFQTHRTPGQDLEVHQTLVPHSATRLLLN